MTCEIVAIGTEFIRLDALLKYSGIAQTGGHAKIMISEGLIQVDGEPCGMRGKKLYPGAVVEAEGRRFQVVAAESE